MLERLLAAGLLALALGACREAAPPQPAAVATSTSTATSTATPTSASNSASAVVPTPAPALASAASLVLLANAVEPTGPAPLSRDGETVVDPGSTFAVELSGALREVRLVLLDAREDHVAATQGHELGATTRFTLAPAAPLVPGSRYLLRLEGATGREMRDATGTALAPVSFAVLAAGTPPPPEPKKPPRKRSRRR